MPLFRGEFFVVNAPSPIESNAGTDRLGTAPLFARDGRIWLPQEAAVGPWSPEALHGGAVSALCVAAAEETLPGPQFVTTRLSLDLVRPVPARPLAVEARVIKSGRRVYLVEIEIRDQGREVALARVQRTSVSPVSLPDLEGTGLEHRPPPDLPGDFPSFDAALAAHAPAPFFRLTTELRTASPAGLFERGTKVAWVRIVAPLTEDQPLSHSAAVAAACDYTNALGAPAMPSQLNLLFANADLSIHLVRNPVSKWVRMAPTSAWLDHGIGHSRCELWDEHGLLGISAVTLPLMQPGNYL
jgi:acyl-CoA thioesterase